MKILFLTTKYSTEITEKMGLDAESKFEQIAEAKGYQVSVTTTKENIYQHIDFKLQPKYFKNISYTVDVKSMKRMYNILQTDKTVVEFKNVLGNAGWIYGKADLIAFQTPEGFLIFDREELQIFSEKYKNEKQLTPIQRNRRNDEFIWIEFKTLKQLDHEVWTCSN